MYGVYVHVPWCRRRCPYCAFAISTEASPPHREYSDAVLREWSLRRDAFDGRPATVSFGGGTPSLAPPAEIARIVRGLDPLPGAEISLEANPGDAPGRLGAWVDAGVTRLSVGVQSFDPWVARRLGRGHTSDDARATVAEAQRAGFRSVSFDLIFAVPGQTLDAFGRDLRAVVELAPDHVSLYGLTIEEGTPFARRRGAPVDDDTWRAMYELAAETLAAAGIHRYEVSNFARAGHRCLHNEHYWRARPWAGLGMAAHGWLPDGTRTRNVTALTEYLARPDPTEAAERPAPDVLAGELLWSTLRHVEGVDRSVLRAHTGLEVRVDPRLSAADLLEDTPDAVRLRPAGFPLADGLARRLADTLHAAG